MFCTLSVCAKVTVVILKIFVSRLAGSHPVVHLTLGLLFQKLNRWQILQNQTLHYYGGLCLQCWILLRPGSQETEEEEATEASLWCKQGLEALEIEEALPLIWPGDDSPIPGTGGDDLR